MATHVLTDVSLTVNSVDLSDKVQSATINYQSDTVEDTAMGDSARSYTGGLKSWSVDVKWHQDYAAGEVDATLFSIVGSSVAFIGKPTSGSVTATNPSFTGNVILTNYTPISGSVGDGHQVSSTFQGVGALTRNTS